MKDLITAIGLLLIIEGAAIAIFPSRIKNMLKLIERSTEKKLRTYGIFFLILGYLIARYLGQ
jgi:uncharacterized protein YjeT (DUF2065 family)|tara:strand:+ start:432 stop:617 length:186 start_codon:yes stop_codon:yes gene_type:complete